MDTKVTRESAQKVIAAINEDCHLDLALRQTGNGLWIVVGSEPGVTCPTVETRLSPELKLREIAVWLGGYLSGRNEILESIEGDEDKSDA